MKMLNSRWLDSHYRRVISHSPHSRLVCVCVCDQPVWTLPLCFFRASLLLNLFPQLSDLQMNRPSPLHASLCCSKLSHTNRIFVQNQHKTLSPTNCNAPVIPGETTYSMQKYTDGEKWALCIRTDTSDCFISRFGTVRRLQIGVPGLWTESAVTQDTLMNFWRVFWWSWALCTVKNTTNKQDISITTHETLCIPWVWVSVCVCGTDWRCRACLTGNSFPQERHLNSLSSVLPLWWKLWRCSANMSSLGKLFSHSRHG